jgi:enoyl-CoA hydratase/carnithine racemase
MSVNRESAMAELPRVTTTMLDSGVAHVQLSRPDKLNALDRLMFAGLIDAAAELAVSGDVRCVVLSGEGRGFCAGIDLSMFADLPQGIGSLTARSHGRSNFYQQAAMAWRDLPVPVIAAVHGVCFGGGLQIAAAADIRIVAADARLAVMEMKWGIVPDMGHFALWRGTVREDHLRELTYTAREFSGEDALRLGFASHLDADPLAHALALAGEIAGKEPTAIRAAKALFTQTPDMTQDQVLIAESAAQEPLLAAKLSAMQRTER